MTSSSFSKLNQKIDRTQNLNFRAQINKTYQADFWKIVAVDSRNQDWDWTEGKNDFRTNNFPIANYFDGQFGAEHTPFRSETTQGLVTLEMVTKNKVRVTGI